MVYVQMLLCQWKDKLTIIDNSEPGIIDIKLSKKNKIGEWIRLEIQDQSCNLTFKRLKEVIKYTFKL